MGYTIADGTTMYTTVAADTLYVAGAKIPAILNSTTECCAFDSLGNPIDLQYKGPAGTPLRIVKAPVFVGDGVATATNANNAGESITSQVGTATATIDAAGTLSFPVGDYEEVVLSNGSTYSFTEGTPTDPSLITYDRSGNGNHITWVNSSAANWALKERSEYPLTDGFSMQVFATEMIDTLELTDTTEMV